jgi:hypothetical protein
MRRLHLAAGVACLALVFALAATVSSCMGTVGIGDACSSDGDCEPPVQQPPGAIVSTACALGRCHYKCSMQSSSFCGAGSECVQVGASYVCTLPDESTCPCPAGLLCGTDKLCHTPCTSPSQCQLSTQTCIEGACVDNGLPDGGPDASPAEAGADSASADTGGPSDSSSRDSAPPADTGTAEAGDGSHPDGSPSEGGQIDGSPKDAPGG